MKNVSRSGAALLAGVIVLSLAACGSQTDEVDAGATAVDSAAAPASEEVAADSPMAEATASPEGEPSPTASASATPSPAPTQAAMERPAAFMACASCHSVEPGKNGLGPSLAGIVGSKAGEVPGFEFSDAMKESGLVFDAATLDRFIENPREVVPGNRMGFAGVKDAEKRAQIVAYLKTI